LQRKAPLSSLNHSEPGTAQPLVQRMRFVALITFLWSLKWDGLPIKGRMQPNSRALA
jgi:hypothetical protein